jgi:hypothetical protein
MKKILLLTPFIFLISCSSDKIENAPNDFKGYYKVISITSETEIDLNNDGVKSLNILEEISSPHTTLNGVYPNLYNAENQDNYVEVRPADQQTNNAQLISFNFPEQSISYINNDMTLNTPVLMEYASSLNINFYYEFIGSNEIKIIDKNREWNSKYGEIKNLTRTDKSNFELYLDKNMFDFSSKQWKSLKLKAKYKKV